MSICKYNSERYSDPTAYEALTAIEREAKKSAFKPLVYICSPYAGAVERNIENARRYSRFAVNKGCIPLAPHLLFPQFLTDDDPAERKLALFMNIVLLTKCAKLWVFGNVISKGMSIEIEKAKQKGIPISYFNDLCEEVSK